MRQDKNICLLKMKKEKENVQEENRGDVEARFFIFLEREREHLLSIFPANPTVGFLLTNNQSGSTRRGQRVDTGFEAFQQLS